MVSHYDRMKRSSIAPYRRSNDSSNRIDKKTGKKGHGLMSKLKDLVSFGWAQEHHKDNDFSARDTGRERTNVSKGSYAAVPGGFFSSDQSSFILRERSRIMNESTMHSEADTSNAKLADFFAKKGNEPLSEIEMEGVLALMQKSRGVADESSFLGNSSRLLGDISNANASQVLRTGNISTYSALNVPNFKPSTDESRNINAKEVENSTIVSTPLKRKNFDYSSIRSPYRTVIYRFDDSNKKKISSVFDKPESSSQEVDETPKPSNSKPLSNTASALVSLLSDKDAAKESIKPMANPYTSHLTALRKSREDLPSINDKITVPKRRQRSETEDKEEAKITSSNGEAQEDTNIPEGIASRKNEEAQDSFTKYKPMRSSSLRDSVSLAHTESNNEKQMNSPKFVPAPLDKNETKETAKSDLTLTSSDKQSESKPSFSFPVNSTTKSTFMGTKKESTSPAVNSQAVKNVSNNETKEIKPQVHECIYDFGNPTSSGFKKTDIDDTLVSKYRGQFVF